MKEVWKEIYDGIDKRILLSFLLSIFLFGFIVFCGMQCIYRICSHPDSDINLPLTKTNKTNFTLWTR